MIRALYSIAGRDVRVRVTPVDKTGKARGKEVIVEPPATTETPVSFSTTLYGRLVGLFARADGTLVVQLDRDDGGRVPVPAVAARSAGCSEGGRHSVAGADPERLTRAARASEKPHSHNLACLGLEGHGVRRFGPLVDSSRPCHGLGRRGVLVCDNVFLAPRRVGQEPSEYGSAGLRMHRAACHDDEVSQVEQDHGRRGALRIGTEFRVARCWKLTAGAHISPG